MSDYVIEYINDRLDCAIEDGGIGYYECGDGKYTHKHEYLALTTGRIMVQYEDEGYPIETRVSGNYRDPETDMELDWLAELVRVEWLGSSRCYQAEYELQQI